MPTVPINGDRQVTTADIPQILATIRHFESGNNYTARSKSSSASGAYQIIDSTWSVWKKAVPAASQYAHAADAPASVQDAVAGAAVAGYIQQFGGWLSAVPFHWYYPKAWNNPVIANQIPPGGGNTMSVAAYAQRWVNYFVSGKADVPGGSVGGGGGGGTSAGDSSDGGVIAPSLTKPPDDPTGGKPLMWNGEYAYQKSTGLPIYTTGGDAYTVVDGKRVNLPVTDIGPGQVVDGVISALNPFNAINSVVDFLKLLANPGTWIRVVKVIGGVVTIIVGLIMMGKQMGLPVGKIAKAAVMV